MPAESRKLIVFLGSVGAFLFLLANLVRTQLFAGAYYHDLAQGNRLREVPIHAPRGIIFDRNGTELTANMPAFRLDGLTISKDQAIAAEAAGRVPEVDSARSYLYGPAFAHVLGYVNIDRVGATGVEEFYQEKLRGRDGKELVEVDAAGNKLRIISTVPPAPGQNLDLTIDAGLQKTAFASLDNRRGVVVVTNPATGEVLALVSSPSFDPNVFTDYSRPVSERSEAISELFSDADQRLFDRSISGTFPPGSTFKLVTATAALETGAIKADTIIEDTGVMIIGPYKFPNWKWLRNGGTDGSLNVVGAIQKSNDIFFYQAGGRTGIDNLVLWARRFGLEAKLGIDLPGETAGIIKTDRDWYLGDTYHTAIGQGDVLVTPLQVNSWTATIANGGKLCSPHVTGKSTCQDLKISRETIDLIHKGMTAACAPGGTAWPLFGFKVLLACKTGTAEFGPSTGSGSATHAWLTVFAPVDKPEIAVTVLIEGGGEGSDVAAPVAKKVLEEWFR